MKPSTRFAKKTWRKVPKRNSVELKLPNKIGYTRCAICKEIISSSKRSLVKDKTGPAKSTIRANRPYGGYLCANCLKDRIIKQTKALSTEK